MKLQTLRLRPADARLSPSPRPSSTPSHRITGHRSRENTFVAQITVQQDAPRSSHSMPSDASRSRFAPTPRSTRRFGDRGVGDRVHGEEINDEEMSTSQEFLEKSRPTISRRERNMVERILLAAARASFRGKELLEEGSTPSSSGLDSPLVAPRSSAAIPLGVDESMPPTPCGVQLVASSAACEGRELPVRRP